MWNLDDKKLFTKVHSFTLSEAFTYGDTRIGQTDKEKRERIRKMALNNFHQPDIDINWWAFRIYVEKDGKRPFDIENVPKLVVDSFCKKQIFTDKSNFKELGLYQDDTIDFVRVVEVGGKRTEYNNMRVEIFGSIKE